MSRGIVGTRCKRGHGGPLYRSRSTRRSQMSPKRSLSVRASEVRPLSSLTLPPFIMGDSAVSWIGPVRSASVCPFCSSSPLAAPPAEGRFGRCHEKMGRTKRNRILCRLLERVKNMRALLKVRLIILSTFHVHVSIQDNSVPGMDTGLANESFL